MARARRRPRRRRRARRRRARGSCSRSTSSRAVTPRLLPGRACPEKGPKTELEFLGQQIIPTGTQFQGTQFGGLSGLAYDERRDVFYAFSDDQVNVRFYTLRIDVSSGVPAVQILAVTTRAGRDRSALRRPDGRPGRARADEGRHARPHLGGLRRPADRPVGARVRPRRPPARARCRSRRLPAERRGHARRAPEPRLRERGDAAERPLPLHRHRGRPRAGRPAGDARGREPGSAAPLQPPDRDARPPVRLLDRSDRRAARARRPSSRSTASSSCCRSTTSSCSRWSARSRSARPGTGNTIKLYRVALPGADDVNGFDSLATLLGGLQPVEKTLLLDLDALGLPLDNVEGMAFGPDLPDGRRSLVLVSDNNFAPAQFTQFLLFAVG